MSKIDTSSYDDEALIAVNNYKKMKDNLQYTITPNSLKIYGLSEKINKYMGIDIDFTKHKEEIAIYKRFITAESLFESDTVIGQKNIIVLTKAADVMEYFQLLNYGKVKDNIFMEDVVQCWENENLDTVNKIKQYLKDKSNEKKSKLEIENTKGMFYQRVMNMVYMKDEGYYEVNLNETTTTCGRAYFDENAFKDFVDMKNGVSAGPQYFVFSEYQKEQYPMLDIKEKRAESMFFNENGEYIASSEKEAKQKIKEAKEKEENVTNTEQEEQQNGESGQDVNNNQNDTNTTSNTTNNTNTNKNKKNNKNNTTSENSISSNVTGNTTKTNTISNNTTTTNKTEQQEKDTTKEVNTIKNTNSTVSNSNTTTEASSKESTEEIAKQDVDKKQKD